MISIEQRLALINAGYSINQIAEFEQQEQQPAAPAAAPAAPAEAPAAAPAAAPAEAPAAAPADHPEQQPQENEGLQLIRDMLKSNQDVVSNVAKLTAAIQANSLANAGLPGSTALPSPEDAIASIIAPKMKERS